MNPYYPPKNLEATEHDRLQQASFCQSCNAPLTADDKAIYMKLISRDADSFLCIDCLGKKLGCGREPIEERIRYYRESGNCTLFR